MPLVMVFAGEVRPPIWLLPSVDVVLLLLPPGLAGLADPSVLPSVEPMELPEEPNNG